MHGTNKSRQHNYYTKRTNPPLHCPAPLSLSHCNYRPALLFSAVAQERWSLPLPPRRLPSPTSLTCNNSYAARRLVAVNQKIKRWSRLSVSLQKRAMKTRFRPAVSMTKRSEPRLQFYLTCFWRSWRSSTSMMMIMCRLAAWRCRSKVLQLRGVRVLDTRGKIISNEHLFELGIIINNYKRQTDTAQFNGDSISPWDVAPPPPFRLLLTGNDWAK